MSKTQDMSNTLLILTAVTTTMLPLGGQSASFSTRSHQLPIDSGFHFGLMLSFLSDILTSAVLPADLRYEQGLYVSNVCPTWSIHTQRPQPPSHRYFSRSVLQTPVPVFQARLLFLH